MNQPPHPIAPRGARPQLFSAPTAAKAGARAKGHADFGPSILATIDGGQARFSTPRDRRPGKKWVLIGLLAVAAAGVYFAVKLNGSPLPETGSSADSLASSKRGVVAVEAAASAPQAPVALGAAAIETVAPVPVAAVNVASPPPAASGIDAIQTALERPEPPVGVASALPLVKKAKAVKKEVPSVRHASAASADAKRNADLASRSPDTDAELLAAMLPHLKHAVPASSPAYQKRCALFSGEALVDCRAKFCNGREGADAACPAATDK